ncbi:MAG: DUF1553 domain-containing protein [Verrucomicrobia bacterium]|nr:DUF1553 domain-containing protein [Verrucomicrobiota bacterium]
MQTSSFTPRAWFRPLRTAALIALLCVCSSRAVRAADSSIFEKQVWPILAEHCIKCHGPEKQKGGLRLDLKAEALRGGDDGPVIVPGKSAESTLIKFVSGTDPDKIMPPKGERLTLAQINGSGATNQHWAFKAPMLPALPAVKSKRWVRNPIDQFIFAKLEQKNLTPAPEADRRTLIRRLSFDLLGLPPSSAEVDAFEKDRRANAYERLVERLLASPHYGERWARHWLDLARFCESHGFEYDKMREHAWRYRDYVIDSFNRDKPYPQFIREQLAGDALEPATRDGIIGASFLTAGTWDEVGNGQSSEIMRRRVREEELEDIVAAVGQTFLGVTVNCARCHAHKFDPIPQTDYYRIKAVFAGVRYGDRSILTPEETTARERETASVKDAISKMERRIVEIEQHGREAVLGQRSANAPKPREEIALPAPFARWTFESDARDQIGSLHGNLEGGAMLANGRLRLDGKTGFLQSAPLPLPLHEKTLEAWLYLANVSQRGGAAISVEDTAGKDFDAIVFGEREPKKWFAGSAFFRRSRDLSAPEEKAKPDELLHVAIVYEANNRITVYRNGVSYADAYTPTGEQTSLHEFPAEKSRVLIGLRHTGAENGFLAGEIEEASLYDHALSAEQIAASFAVGVSRVDPAEIQQALSENERDELSALRRELQERQERLKALATPPMAYAGVRQQPPPVHRLIRGDVEKPAETVTPGALSAVAKPSPDFGLAEDAPEAERRRKFADWVASAENPLTARVMVNRIWQQHFGTGIVGSPSDFGLNGERPSHPELLDWLALKFVEQGWSVKQLHRLIVTSSTYRQTSTFNEKAATLDADNRLLWHFAPRRLEGEALRDAMLAVSGQLNPELGGPSFRPFETSTFGSVFYKLTDPAAAEFNRRTIYRMNINSGKSPLLDAFDCPDPSFKTPLRRVTTTPLQALGLMNSSFAQRQANYFAQRLKREAGANVSAQIKLAYQLAFSRLPQAEEAALATALARDHGMKTVCWTLLNSSEFLHVK